MKWPRKKRLKIGDGLSRLKLEPYLEGNGTSHMNEDSQFRHRGWGFGGRVCLHRMAAVKGSGEDKGGAA